MEGERIAGILPNLITGSLERAKSYNLIVTNYRIIGMIQVPKVQKPEDPLKSKRLQRTERKDKGVLQHLWKISAEKKRSQRQYRGLNFEAILKENKDNFLINNNLVQEIRIIKSESAFDDSRSEPPEKISIKWSTGTLKFKTRQGSASFDDTWSILTKVFGNIVRY